MNHRAFSKSIFVFASGLAMICAPVRVFAKHGGTKGSGGSHSGGSRGGHSFHASNHGSSHAASHSSFKSGGHASREGSHGTGRISSARLSSGPGNGGRFHGSDGNYSASRGGFSPRSTNTFASRGFGSAEGTRNFGGFGQSQSHFGQSARAETGQWRNFGNSGSRSLLASAHAPGNFAGNGWHSFGNTNYGHGTSVGRPYENSGRGDGQWRSFGNPRSFSAPRNFAGFSNFGTGRVSASRFHSFNPDVANHSFSSGSGLRHSSSFPSYSSRRLEGDFRGSRFNGSNFGGAGFGNAGLYGSGFSDGNFGGGLGQGLSLFPNLLNSFLSFGAPAFGGPGALAANALSLAVRLFVSAASAGEWGQDGYAGTDNGFTAGGPGGIFGAAAASPWTGCAEGGPPWAPDLGPGVSCGAPGYARFNGSFVGAGQPAGSGINFGLGFHSRR